MSATSECVPCCGTTPLAVSVPGSQGATGPYPITTTTASFVIPAVGQNVTVAVVSTVPFIQNQNVFVGNANFTVAAINSPTSITLTAVDFQGDATGTVASGSTLVGGVGNLKSPTILSLLTATFTVPAVAGSATASVNDATQLSVGLNIFLGGANFIISVISGTAVTLITLGFTLDSAPGTVISSGTPLISGVGNVYAAASRGVSLANITVPAVGGSITFRAVPADMFYPGMIMLLVNNTQAAHFVVTSSNNSNFAVTATFLGFPGDVAPTTVISLGAEIIPGLANQNFQSVVINDATGTFNNYTVNTVSVNAHGIKNTSGVAAIPRSVRVMMRCVTTDANSGYVAGQEISLDRITGGTQSFQPIGWFIDATNITFVNNGVGAGAQNAYKICEANGTASVVFNDGTGGSANQANFQLRAYLEA